MFVSMIILLLLQEFSEEKVLLTENWVQFLFFVLFVCFFAAILLIILTTMNHVAHIDLIIKTTIRKKNIGLLLLKTILMCHINKNNCDYHMNNSENSQVPHKKSLFWARRGGFVKDLSDFIIGCHKIIMPTATTPQHSEKNNHLFKCVDWIQDHPDNIECVNL